MKADLDSLLNQEQALQAARKQTALSFAASPTLVRQRVAKRTDLDDEDDMDLTEKPPDELKQPSKAPKTDKTALCRSIMTKADQQINNFTKAAGASAVQK